MKPPATSDLSVSKTVSKTESIKNSWIWKCSHVPRFLDALHTDFRTWSLRSCSFRVLADRRCPRFRISLGYLDISWTPQDPGASNKSRLQTSQAMWTRCERQTWSGCVVFVSGKWKTEAHHSTSAAHLHNICTLNRQNLTSGSKHETLDAGAFVSLHRLDGPLRMFISEQDPAWKMLPPKCLHDPLQMLPIRNIQIRFCEYFCYMCFRINLHGCFSLWISEWRTWDWFIGSSVLQFFHVFFHVSLPLSEFYEYLHPLNPFAACSAQDNTDVWARYPQRNTGATWAKCGRAGHSCEVTTSESKKLKTVRWGSKGHSLIQLANNLSTLVATSRVPLGK